MAITKEGENNLVHDIKISSVVPGKITGENKTYELKGIDLAMKLHYLKGLYFFNNPNSISDNEEGNPNTSFVSILDIKKVMFDVLVVYFKACGRIRVSSSETGERASIKLNDAGVRIVEAQSSKTVEEWLALEGFLSLQDHLVYNDDGLGPDLPFSPLVCLQVTWFKCGGISVGISWAHVLGDAFSAVEFMNTLGRYIYQGSYKQKPKLISLQDPPKSKYPLSKSTREPISVKRVDSVGSHWVLPYNSKIGFHAFHLTSNQLGELHSTVHGTKMNDNCTSQYFEVITSIIWRSIAKIRNDLETNVVTICRPKSIKRQQIVPHNGQILGVVEANFTISNVDPLKLVHLVVDGVIDESDMVEELVNKETDESDFFVYGANLTFVDIEKADVYGFEMKEKYPRFASYSIGEIGDKGVVLVLPCPKDENNKGNDGKLIVVQLLEDEIEPLKSELKEEWCIE